jgi:protease I
MANELKGKKIAFLATDKFEQVELTDPWHSLEKAGAELELIAPHDGQIEGVNHGEPGDKFEVHRTLKEADPSDYDGLVLPGGVKNPDTLRQDEDAVRFVRAFFEAGKPVGAICHGPWMLVEADVVKGRTLTSYPSLKTDIRNAGGKWVDKDVVVDNGLVTSRGPDDLPAFCAKLVEEFAEGEHEQRKRSA